MDTLQRAVPIFGSWKSELRYQRSIRGWDPNFHPSTKAGLRIARPGLWTTLEIRTGLAGNPPVVQHSHIRAVLIWKSGTRLACNSHAVLPRIPTSPQQTTTAAIYTYLFRYFRSSTRRTGGGARHQIPFLWSLTLDSVGDLTGVHGDDRSPEFPANSPAFHSESAARMVLFGFLHFRHASGVECGQSTHVPQPIPGSRTCPP